MESVSTEGGTIKVEPKKPISVTTKLVVSEEVILCDNEPIKEDGESAPESSDTKCFVDVKFEEEFIHDENVREDTNLFSKDSALCTGSKPIKEENKSALKSSGTKRRQEGRDDDNCKRRKLKSNPIPASLTKAPSPSPRLARHEVVDTEAHGEGSEESEESDGGTPPSAPSAKPPFSKAPASKKKRTYSILPEEKEMAVAKWYREHELLYNKKLRAYRDRERKDIAYRQMAAEMNVTVECLQKWLENMRTRFAKLILLKSGQETKSLTERDQWIKETFSFLRPHIVRCHTRKSKLYQAASQDTQGTKDTKDTSPDASSHAIDVVEVVLDDPDDLQEGSSGAPKHQQTATQRRKESAQGTPTDAEKELLDKLREAEHRHALFCEEWKVAQRRENRQVQELEQFHQFLMTSLGTLDQRLLEHYMIEVLKMAHGMKAYSRGTGGMPRVTIPEMTQPQQPLIPPPQQPTYETLNGVPRRETGTEYPLGPGNRVPQPSAMRRRPL